VEQLDTAFVMHLEVMVFIWMPSFLRWRFRSLVNILGQPVLFTSIDHPTLVCGILASGGNWNGRQSGPLFDD
jgi:hypothetical protein